MNRCGFPFEGSSSSYWDVIWTFSTQYPFYMLIKFSFKSLGRYWTVHFPFQSDPRHLSESCRLWEFCVLNGLKCEIIIIKNLNYIMSFFMLGSGVGAKKKKETRNENKGNHDFNIIFLENFLIIVCFCVRERVSANC